MSLLDSYNFNMLAGIDVDSDEVASDGEITVGKKIGVISASQAK